MAEVPVRAEVALALSLHTQHQAIAPVSHLLSVVVETSPIWLCR